MFKNLQQQNELRVRKYEVKERMAGVKKRRKVRGRELRLIGFIIIMWKVIHSE